MICRICRGSLDTESPYVIREVNPLTFRYAWMHDECWQEAYEDLGDLLANDPAKYFSRKDEYEQKAWG